MDRINITPKKPLGVQKESLSPEQAKEILTQTPEDAEWERFKSHLKWAQEHQEEWKEADKKREERSKRENIVVLNPDKEEIYKKHLSFFKNHGFTDNSILDGLHGGNIPMSFSTSSKVSFVKEEINQLLDILFQSDDWSIEASERYNSVVDIDYVFYDGLVIRKVRS